MAKKEAVSKADFLKEAEELLDKKGTTLEAFIIHSALLLVKLSATEKKRVLDIFKKISDMGEDTLQKFFKS